MREGRHTESGEQEARPRTNVVRLPRDWLGPRDELVPFGPRASSEDAEEPPPTAEDFWGERSASIHDALQAPADSVDAPAGTQDPQLVRSTVARSRCRRSCRRARGRDRSRVHRVGPQRSTAARQRLESRRRGGLRKRCFPTLAPRPCGADRERASQSQRASGAPDSPAQDRPAHRTSCARNPADSSSAPATSAPARRFPSTPRTRQPPGREPTPRPATSRPPRPIGPLRLPRRATPRADPPHLPQPPARPGNRARLAPSNLRMDKELR